MAAPVFHNNMTLGDLLDVLRTMNDEERMQFYNQLNISLELTIVGVSAEFLPLVDKSLLIGIPRRENSAQRGMTVRVIPLSYCKPKGKSLT